jgi:hypothetical protein
MESALVFVSPEESVEAIVAKARATGARRVDLLVPQGAAALRAAGGFDRLNRALARDGVSVLVFSADPEVLSAARRSSLEVVRIEGADVVVPANGAPPASADDAALLAALDSLPSSQHAYAGGAEDDLLPALDEPPSQARRHVGAQRLPGETPVLPDWDDLLAESVDAQTIADMPEPYPAEIALDETEMARARERSRLRDAEEPVSRRGRGLLLGLLALGALLAALLLAAIWLFGQRATVAIVPPAAPPAATLVDPIVVPLEAETPAEGAISVQARPLSSAAEVSANGQATLRAPAPAGSARGTISIVNNSGSACALPAGSDVLVTNAAGQQVVFATDQDVTVGPVTEQTTSSGLSTTTVRTAGSGSVPVTARAPGSASNIPGGGAASIPTCNWVSASAGAIEGGAEQETLIVGEEDLNALLGQALADLYNRGVGDMQAQAAASGLTLEQGTISPGPDALAGERRYELVSVVPGVGQTVPDPNNPVFTLVVRASFSALATSQDKPLDEQVRLAVQNQLLASGRLRPADEANITSWAWNGQELRAAAEIITTRDENGLPEGFVGQLQRELVGKSSQEARELLERYKAQGLIGDYRLPERAAMPDWSFLLDVEVAGA